MKFQFYWKWRKPWYNFYPRDEDGPAEIYFGVGPLQFHTWLYEGKHGTIPTV